MPNTTRMKWPIPSENQDPWYDAISNFFTATDASGYAGRENDNAILTEGGTIAFNDTTGVLSWAATLNVISAYAGYKWTLPAGQVTLDDGQLAYVSLVRAPTRNIAISMSAAYQLPLDDNSFVIAIRSGDTVYFRNGSTVAGGFSIPNIGGGGSSGSTAAGADFDDETTTSDATPKTITTLLTSVNDSVTVVDASFVAIDKTANHVFEQGTRAVILRDELGTLTVKNVNNYSGFDADDPTWSATVTDDGGDNILLQVTGDATNVVHWFVSGKMKVHY
jgi:hypothetical protein